MTLPLQRVRGRPQGAGTPEGPGSWCTKEFPCVLGRAGQLPCRPTSDGVPGCPSSPPQLTHHVPFCSTPGVSGSHPHPHHGPLSSELRPVHAIAGPALSTELRQLPQGLRGCGERLSAPGGGRLVHTWCASRIGPDRVGVRVKPPAPHCCPARNHASGAGPFPGAQEELQREGLAWTLGDKPGPPPG